jgi:hypothetical protein
LTVDGATSEEVEMVRRLEVATGLGESIDAFDAVEAAGVKDDGWSLGEAEFFSGSGFGGEVKILI